MCALPHANLIIISFRFNFIISYLACVIFRLVEWKIIEVQHILSD